MFVGLFLILSLSVFFSAQEEIECTDSDGGINPLVKGIINTEKLPNGGEDYCAIRTGNLIEKFCKGGAEYKITYRNGTVGVVNEVVEYDQKIHRTIVGTIYDKGYSEKEYFCPKGCLDGACENAEEIIKEPLTYACHEKSSEKITWLGSDGRENGDISRKDCLILWKDPNLTFEQMDDDPNHVGIDGKSYFKGDSCEGDDCFLQEKYCGENSWEIESDLTTCLSCSKGVCLEYSEYSDFKKLLNWFRNLFS